MKTELDTIEENIALIEKIAKTIPRDLALTCASNLRDSLTSLQEDYVLVKRADVPQHLKRDAGVAKRLTSKHSLEMVSCIKAAQLLANAMEHE